MQSLFVQTHQSRYEIIISNTGFEWIAKDIQTQLSVKKWLIITDENVANLYLEQFIESLWSDKLNLHNYIIVPGEGSKSLKKAEEIIDFLSEHSFTRKDGIIALGGGVVGDLAGFVASIYLRGIPWVQVPTTLLAQVDSSVGGKVAVNTSYGKNLIGSFYQPKRVYVEMSFLKTLDLQALKSGLGEVIKYACIYDYKLFELLEQSDLKNMDWSKIVYGCINIKKHFVEQDEREEGLRKHLNFGHTLGHALEKYHDYKCISHGEGVVKGMIFASWLSKDLGLLASDSYQRICNLIKKYDYSLNNYDYILEKLYPMILKDKKSQGDGIDFVLLKKIGQSLIFNLSNEYIKEKLDEGRI